MLTRARLEVRQLMEGLPLRRPPALRRALKEGWMLATDLPLAAGEEEVAAFRRRAADAGWRLGEEASWLLLDKPSLLRFPDAGEELPAGEKGCVYSLLRRHPALGEDLQALRLVAFASELGPEDAERLYLRIHRRWAEALRLGRV